MIRDEQLVLGSLRAPPELGHVHPGEPGADLGGMR
jgi:hypothetical protein